MTMNYLGQGILIAGVVNLLLAVAWYIGRTVYLENEDRTRAWALKFLSKRDRSELSKRDYLAGLELWYEPSLLSLNYPDFGAMLISALLMESGVTLFYYMGGLFYYFGILLIFSGTSSIVWIFSGMASSFVGSNERLLAAISRAWSAVDTDMSKEWEDMQNAPTTRPVRDTPGTPDPQKS